MKKVIWSIDRIIAHLEDTLKHFKELQDCEQIKYCEELSFSESHVNAALHEILFFKEKVEDAK
jgi:hypothetical protein